MPSTVCVRFFAKYIPSEPWRSICTNTWSYVFPIRIGALQRLDALCFSSDKVTEGTLASVTIASSNLVYSTARDCAANSLEFRGMWGFGVNADYYGLGKQLGCGCSSINGCLCGTGEGCADIADIWTADLNSMLGMYGSYYSTANAAAETKDDTPAATTATGASHSVSSGTTQGQGITLPSKTGESATSNSTSDAEFASKAGGLSQSDMVALAASLGVGIPSMLMAAVTLWVQLRKKKNRAAKSESMTQMVPQGAHVTADDHDHETSKKSLFR
ncbi:hypothetical protein BJ170DRAFT_716206 [Xylariales sp. AK1849]|nr:hypothetical protein BJ170DRAFT_716206 [Xylariales sp. AK1849]